MALCPTCETGPTSRYCAPARCYCAHPDCHAAMSYIDMAKVPHPEDHRPPPRKGRT